MIGAAGVNNLNWHNLIVLNINCPFSLIPGPVMKSPLAWNNNGIAVYDHIAPNLLNYFS